MILENNRAITKKGTLVSEDAFLLDNGKSVLYQQDHFHLVSIADMYRK